jgi:hypothetical protein
MRWNPTGREEVMLVLGLEWICASDMQAVKLSDLVHRYRDMEHTGGETSDRGRGCGARGREGAVSAQNQPMVGIREQLNRRIASNRMLDDVVMARELYSTAHKLSPGRR